MTIHLCAADMKYHFDPKAEHRAAAGRVLAMTTVDAEIVLGLLDLKWGKIGPTVDFLYFF